MYIYPDNLKSKATLWLWELRDIGIVGIRPQPTSSFWVTPAREKVT